MSVEITLPNGVKIQHSGSISIRPDGTIDIEGDLIGETAINENSTVEPDLVPHDPHDPLDADECGEDYSVDATMLTLLEPGVDRNVYLSVLDRILNITAVHFEVLDFMFIYDDEIQYLDLARKMEITDGAILGRVQVLLKLDLIQRVSRGIYMLDGVALDVMSDWRDQIIKERTRRSMIAQAYRERIGKE